MLGIEDEKVNPGTVLQEIQPGYFYKDRRLRPSYVAIAKKKNDMVIGNVIGSNVMNMALVVPIIGFFSDVSFDSTIFSRDYLVMAVATILFVLVAASYSSNKVNIKLIKFVGCVFVAGYIGYILNLSNLI